MVLPDPPTGNAPLIQLLIVHICAFSSEVCPDAMSGTTPLIAVPFGRIVFPDPADNVIGFLRMPTCQRRNGIGKAEMGEELEMMEGGKVVKDIVEKGSGRG